MRISRHRLAFKLAGIALLLIAPQAASRYQVVHNNDRVEKRVAVKKAVKKKSTSGAPKPKAPSAPRVSSPSFTTETLMRLEPGEYVHQNEYMSSWRAHKRDFAFVTYNPNRRVYSYIVNGTRQIESPREINVLFANPDNLQESAILYQDFQDRLHLNVNGKDHYPVDEIHNVWIGPSTFKVSANIGGKLKLIDSDGSSQSMRDADNLGAGPLVFHSPNGKNFVSFTNKGNTVVHNGRKHDLSPNADLATPPQAVIRKVTITDDNQLMVEGIFDKTRGIFIGKNGMKREYNPSLYTACFSCDDIAAVDDDDDDDNDYHYGYQLSTPWYYEFTDPSYRHSFSSDWENDYVIIDGNPMGDACAVYAYYDDYRKALVWITADSSALKLNVYRIP